MSQLTHNPPSAGGALAVEADAAVCRTFGEPLSIERISVAPPGPGQVRVRVTATAICHSDVMFIDGHWGGSLPAVWGHESAGVIESIGPGVPAKLIPGTAVAMSLIRSCGGCASCAASMPVNCTGDFSIDEGSPLTDMAGHALVHGLGTATFCEYAVVDASQVVPIPSGLDHAAAALLGCGVITGFGAVANTAGVEPGAHVAVIGCGGVGLNAVQGAAIAGAATVTAIDVLPEKVQAAAAFGATHGIAATAPDGSSVDVAAELQQVTGAAGADYVFVTVGAKAATESAFALAAPGGAIVLVGMAANGVTVEVDTTTVAALNQRILGSKMGSGRLPVDIPKLVDLHRAGRLQLDELISGRFALAEIDAALDGVRAGTAMRNVIEFDVSESGAP